MPEGRMQDGFVPGRHGIDAYGNGGFRFAEMSHRGSALFLPSGVRAWAVAAPGELKRASFAPVLAEAADIELLLVGTGVDLVPLDAILMQHLRDTGLRVEVMQTGSAARTFNILLAENRRVAAALIAV